MATHNCEECSAKGNCPIESIASWLNEHENKADAARIACAESLIIACAIVTSRIGLGTINREDILAMAVSCFLLGYQKGRTHQDVPDVFKDSFKEKR